MPVMDGVTATKIIRTEISSNIPIIALTANAIKGKKEQYIQSGMNDCITKPYDEDKMISLISIWINNTSELTFGSSEPDLFEAIVVEETVPDNEPLFDIKKLLQIGGGNNDFIMQMLKLFINDVPQSVQKIKDAYDTRDYETMKYLTHRIRPSLHNMSVNSIKNEVLQIEKLAEKAENHPSLEKMIDNMIHVTNKVVVQLKSEYNI